MICWKCGLETDGDVCPGCGCVQSSRQEPASEVGFALRYAYDKFGPQRILTDHDTLSDLLPDERKLRQHMKAVLNTNFSDQLYGLMRQGGGLDDKMLPAVISGLQTVCGLTEEQVLTVLGYFMEMIGLPPIRIQAAAPPVPPPPPVPPSPPPAPPKNDSAPARPNVAPQSVPVAAPREIPTQGGVLAELKNVVAEDATHGVGGSVARGAKRNKLVVRSDGVFLYQYQNRKAVEPDAQPWLVIPANAIFKVSEHFFLGSYEFTIVLRDGRRYRIIPSARKEPVLRVIEAIRMISGNH